MRVQRISGVSCLLLVLTFSRGAYAAPQNRPVGVALSEPVVSGEHFVKHVIPDSAQGGMPAAALHLPDDWRFQSNIEWNYGWIENPVAFSARGENPANAEAFFYYPLIRCDYTEIPPRLQSYVKKSAAKPGDRLPLGAINLAPRPPLQAMVTFVRQVRGQADKFQWIGSQDLPDLAKTLGLDALSNQHGIAIKVGYEMNGQPVEEAFYGVYYLEQTANAGVNAGQIKQTNWGLQALQSFRAPTGTLEKRMPVFCAIARSLSINPQWHERAKQINARLLAIFNQHLKEGYDDLSAAQRLRDEVMKNQAQFNSTLNAQMASNRKSGGGRSSDDSGTGESDGSGGGRSVADGWSDRIRGVDTVKDPVTGTSQHSSTEQFHWTDGFGNYRHSNDPNYVPGRDEPGDWKLMPSAS